MSEVQIKSRYIEFSLGSQLYAIPLLTVKEVILKPETTAVPNMPSYFEGMINLRGQVLGIYNLRKKMGAKSKDNNELANDVVIIIENNGINVGMIVDEVTRVLNVESSMIGPAPLKEDDPARNFINSVIRVDGELVMTVNVVELLELEKFKKLQKVA